MKSKDFLTDKTLFEKLRKELPRGAQGAIANDLNLSQPYVNKVLHGKTEGMKFETAMKVLECALSYAKRSNEIEFEKELKKQEVLARLSKGIKLL